MKRYTVHSEQYNPLQLGIERTLIFVMITIIIIIIACYEDIIIIIIIILDNDDADFVIWEFIDIHYGYPCP